MNENTIPRMLTITEAAKESNMSYNSVRQLCIDGKVKTIKIGTKWMINCESFITYLRNNN